MFCVSLHTLLLGLSFPSALLGLTLVLKTATPEAEASDGQVTTEHLLRMIFVYWAVYCLAAFGQKLLLPAYPELAVPLRLTGIFTYLLTLASVLCLPLNYIETRRLFQKG